MKNKILNILAVLIVLLDCGMLYLVLNVNKDTSNNKNNNKKNNSGGSVVIIDDEKEDELEKRYKENYTFLNNEKRIKELLKYLYVDNFFNETSVGIPNSYLNLYKYNDALDIIRLYVLDKANTKHDIINKDLCYINPDSTDICMEVPMKVMEDIFKRYDFAYSLDQFINWMEVNYHTFNKTDDYVYFFMSDDSSYRTQKHILSIVYEDSKNLQLKDVTDTRKTIYTFKDSKVDDIYVATNTKDDEEVIWKLVSVEEDK